MKAICTETTAKYGEFTVYVLAMAKALEAPLFVKTLNLLNTAHKYYADLLAHRTAIFTINGLRWMNNPNPLTFFLRGNGFFFNTIRSS
jgi:hypothetical protein